MYVCICKKINLQHTSRSCIICTSFNPYFAATIYRCLLKCFHKLLKNLPRVKKHFCKLYKLALSKIFCLQVVGRLMWNFYGNLCTMYITDKYAYMNLFMQIVYVPRDYSFYILFEHVKLYHIICTTITLISIYRHVQGYTMNI